VARVVLQTQERYFRWLLGGMLVLIWVRNLLLDVMDVDASQYAAMSIEMLARQSFLVITDRGEPYLDKPPLLFWLSSLSYMIFGISNFAYKLPSVLMALVGVYSTYRLARLYYSEEVAEMSAWILAACQGFCLMTNDVRTDTLLMGSLALALWQLMAWFEGDKHWKHLVLGAIGIAMAMLTKGPIGLMVPILAIGGHLLLKGRIGEIFHPAILVVLAIVAVLLYPMCWGLYEQHGTKGLVFYFWTQSFGRLTGDSEWRNNMGPFFFFGTLFWTFAPWAVLAFLAAGIRFFELVKSRIKREAVPEWLSLFGTVLPFIAFSASNYKLPHYIYVIFPLAAVLSASLLGQVTKWGRGWLLGVQLILQLLLFVVAGLFLFFFFPVDSLADSWLYLLPVLLLAAGQVALWVARLTFAQRLVYSSALALLAFNFVLSYRFYPELFKYQAGSTLGPIVTRYEADRCYGFRGYGHSFNVYAHRITPMLDDTTELNAAIRKHTTGKDKRGIVVYVGQLQLDTLSQLNYPMQILHSADDYSVSLANYKFLNPDTRYEQVKRAYLVEIKSLPSTLSPLSSDELYDYGMEVYSEEERNQAMARTNLYLSRKDTLLAE
jgi:4-amino-4-deoxy-L-arabinose transferase-like glycosyltransferase